MKAWAAMISMVLVLLSTGVAESQPATPRQGAPGGVRVAPRRPVPARPPGFVQPPGFAQQPGFAQHRGFAQHPGFVQRPGLVQRRGFAQQPGFVRNSGFAHQPFVPRSPAFVRAARFPFRSGFVTNQIFLASGSVVAPWPYWYIYPPQAYAQPQYWAYCQSPEGYYPYVQDCPGGWEAVAPTPPAPEWWRSSPDTDRQPTDGTSTEEIREQIARSRSEPYAGVDLAVDAAASPALPAR